MDEYNPITVSLLMNPKRSDISWSSVSFACGGWLQFYLFGVARALQHCKVDRGVIYAGCSAGALAATGIALGGDFDGNIWCRTHISIYHILIYYFFTQMLYNIVKIIASRKLFLKFLAYSTLIITLKFV